MNTNRLYRYRVPVVRRNADASPADSDLREHIYLHATNAIAAQLLARAVTGAAIALEPERIGEVESVEPVIGMGESGGLVVFA